MKSHKKPLQRSVPWQKGLIGCVGSKSSCYKGLEVPDGDGIPGIHLVLVHPIPHLSHPLLLEG